MKLDFKINKTAEGKIIICHQIWNPQITEIALNNEIFGIYYHPMMATQRIDLNFLSNFPELEKFNFSAYDNEPIENFEQIYELTELKALSWETPWNCKLDFHRFSKLENLNYGWHPGSTISKCLDIKVLSLHRCKSHDLSEISTLTNLEKLQLFSCRTQHLVGLEKMKNLKSLRLSCLSQLQDIGAVRFLSSLRELWIASCRKVLSLDALSSNSTLQEIIIEDSGDIESLGPLLSLKNLENLAIIGKTTILDGDLSVLEKLESLKSVFYVNRKHYSHKREYFETILNDRGTING